MKKLALFLAVFIIFLAPAVSAASLDVSVSPAHLDVDAGDAAVFNLYINNGLSTEDTFIITHSGEKLIWMFAPESAVTVPAGSTEALKLAFVPGKEEGLFTFNVTVTGNKSKLTQTLTYSMKVSIPNVVTIENLGMVKEGNYLFAEADIKSREPRDLDVVFEIRDSSGNLIASQTESRRFYRTVNVEKTFQIDSFPPAEYSLTVSTLDQTESKAFRVEAVHDVIERVDTESNVFFEEVTIEVLNNGNAAENGYVVETLIPHGDFITGFFMEPAYCESTEDGQLCSFVVNLMPGEREEIVYRMDFWPSYTKIAASVMIIIIFIAFYLLWISRPKINKTYRRKGKHDHHVIIEVKAPRHKSLQNVIIRDWVSPLASVLHKEFQHAAPVLRKSDAGTELIWKLGNIAKKEERILSYKIKTLVQGNLKMPKAYIRFTDDNGKIVRVYSKPGTVA